VSGVTAAAKTPERGRVGTGGIILSRREGSRACPPA
jgi:hypothetical protein